MPRRRVRAFQCSGAILLILSCLVWPRAASATVFVVADGDVVGLTAAITAANNEGVNPGPDVIDLADNGTYTLVGINNLVDGLNGLPSVTSHVTIQGDGATIQRSTAGGVPAMRLFHVATTGNLTLIDLTLHSGSATDQLPTTEDVHGGAIYSKGTLILDGVTVRDSDAQGKGGGIFASGGSVSVTNGTLSGNSAGVNGGALAFAASVSGTLLNATITHNSAANSGGGLATASSSMAYKNSIVAGNSAGSPQNADCETPTALTSNGFNLVGAGTGCPTLGSDLTTGNIANELNTILADNGGPTETHALISGSQAIDAGTDTGAPAVDQRNQARPVDGNADCTATTDIGAYEHVLPPAVLIVPSSGSTNVAETGPTTDTYTVQLQTQPSGSVDITSSVADGQTLVSNGGPFSSSSTLSFTTVDWCLPKTVTVLAVDDAIVEGPHVGTIAHTASGAAEYVALNPLPNLTANITDNDIAGVIVDEVGGLAVSEPGPETDDNYIVALTAQPSGTVTITATALAGQTVVSKDLVTFGSFTTLTFTSGDWSTPQVVYVRVVDDLVDETSPHTGTIMHTASGGGYGGTSIASATADITDNDAAGVIVTESGGSTNVDETGPTTDTYTVVLTSQPSATTTITAVADAQTLVSKDGVTFGASTTLTFASGNWFTPQTVTVRAVDDAVAEVSPHTGTINHSASGAAEYVALNPLPGVAANITDNDNIAVIVTESSGSTDVAEGGATDTYTLVLGSQPTSSVTISFNTGTQLQAIANVTFTTGDWSTPKTITVAAVGDGIVEGAHSGTITHTASSSDANYNGISIASVTANITDDDSYSVIVTPVTANVSEATPGTSDTYTVRLDSQPTADVTIAVSAGDGQTLVSNASGGPFGASTSLTFTSVNWNTNQTVFVRALDDCADETSPHGGTITHSANSTDLNYNGITISNVAVSITDNDSSAMVIAQTGGNTSVSEAGPTTDTYTVRLDSDPAANVTVGVTGNADVEVSNDGVTFGNTTSLSFLAGGACKATQTVTVRAIDDLIDETSPEAATITNDPSSAGDPAYDALATQNVTVNVTDNDSSGAIVTESGGGTNVTEGGAADTYTVVLDSQPTSDVTISFDTGSQIQAISDLTFTTGDWNTPQVITVVAVDDGIAEGAHTGTIAHAASSADSNYDGIAIASVTAAIADNDAGVIVGHSGGSTVVNETGPTADGYNLVLTTQPTASVTITATVLDGQTAVSNGGPFGSSTAVTFTAADWSVPQTVTVRAVDDAVDEASPHTGTITHTASGAAEYVALNPLASVTANITDNDPGPVSFAVTKTADTSDGACDADCSLREAVLAANATPGADTIRVPAGTYALTLTGSGEEAAATGDLDVDGELEILGAGAPRTIVDGNGTDRIFQILGGAVVRIVGVTIRNGDALGGPGGGVLNGGNLTLKDCAVTGSHGDEGGGVAVAGAGSQLTLQGVTASDNSAASGGALALLCDPCTATLANTTLSGNQATGSGGAVSQTGGTLVLANATIANNTADDDGSGGESGGGLGGLLGGTVTLRNTILAGNADGGGAPDCADCLGCSSQGYNIVGNGDGCSFPATTGDQVGTTANPVDPVLGALTGNRGPTQTHALLPGSAAIDSANPAFPGSGGSSCSAIDQRSFLRPWDGNVDASPACDVGAFEVCSPTFADVPPGAFAEASIKELYCRGITSGCSAVPLSYCPAASVSRRQVAVFLIRLMGASPSAVPFNQYFDDVPDDFYAPFVNRVFELGMTSGCGPRLFCPGSLVTRGQTAVFLIRALGETPSTAPFNQYFDDVPDVFFAAFVNRLFELGITSGCGPRLFCPTSALSRAQMAVFLIAALPAAPAAATPSSPSLGGR